MVKMNFIGVAEGQEYFICVDDHDNNNGVYTVFLNDKKYKVDAQTLPSEIVSALINNKSYDLELDKEQSEDPLDGQIAIRVRGRVLRLEMLEERRKKMKDSQNYKFKNSDNSQIRSLMSGKVLRCLVKENEEVKEGQGLLVIEAMKMENEIKALKKGIVKSILVKEGQVVEASSVLMNIE